MSRQITSTSDETKPFYSNAKGSNVESGASAWHTRKHSWLVAMEAATVVRETSRKEAAGSQGRLNAFGGGICTKSARVRHM